MAKDSTESIDSIQLSECEARLATAERTLGHKIFILEQAQNKVLREEESGLEVSPEARKDVERAQKQIDSVQIEINLLKCQRAIKLEKIQRIEQQVQDAQKELIEAETDALKIITEQREINTPRKITLQAQVIDKIKLATSHAERAESSLSEANRIIESCNSARESFDARRREIEGRCRELSATLFRDSTFPKRQENIETLRLMKLEESLLAEISNRLVRIDSLIESARSFAANLQRASSGARMAANEAKKTLDSIEESFHKMDLDFQDAEQRVKSLPRLLREAKEKLKAASDAQLTAEADIKKAAQKVAKKQEELRALSVFASRETAEHELLQAQESYHRLDSTFHRAISRERDTCCEVQELTARLKKAQSLATICIQEVARSALVREQSAVDLAESQARLAEDGANEAASLLGRIRQSCEQATKEATATAPVPALAASQVDGVAGGGASSGLVNPPPAFTNTPDDSAEPLVTGFGSHDLMAISNTTPSTAKPGSFLSRLLCSRKTEKVGDVMSPQESINPAIRMLVMGATGAILSWVCYLIVTSQQQQNQNRGL
jgi:hypothetical protein